MAFNVVRDIIGPKLKLRSYLAFRFIVPLVVYGWLSLNLAMVCGAERHTSQALMIAFRRSIFRSNCHLTQSTHTPEGTSLNIVGGHWC